MNLNYRLALFLFLPGFITISCDKNRSREINKFSDPSIVKIADLKDRRISDSLYAFLYSNQARYRFEAASAFASIQDTAAIDDLFK